MVVDVAVDEHESERVRLAELLDAVVDVLGVQEVVLESGARLYQQVTRSGARGRPGVDALQVEQTSRGTDLVVWYDVAVLPLHGADVRDDWVPFLRAARTGQCAPAPSEHNEERT